MTSRHPAACVHGLSAAACCLAVAMLLAVVHLFAVGTRAHAQADATVSITAPGEGQTVTGDLQVRGTVQGAGLQSYFLYWRVAGEGEDGEIYFDGGQEAVNASMLGVWRAGDNPPGEYEIRLEAQFEGRDPTETIVRFTLADAAATTEPAPETSATMPAEDQTLRQSLDQLAARARPAALAAYLTRGMQFGLTVALIVLVYFGVKAVVVWLLGSRKP